MIGEVDFEQLLREVLNRVNGVLDEQARLRLLLDTVVSITADMSLDGVLARIVEMACELTDAEFAALGILGPGDGRELRTFVHHGMDPVLVGQIGSPPTGHGLLGLLFEEPEPLRLHDIVSDPHHYGFPPGHPTMSSFLGVPVRVVDRVFGNLYLTEKRGGVDFSLEDEHVVVALAAAASVAIENARRYEEAQRREVWLAATAEITGVLSGNRSAQGALQLIADCARQVAASDVAWILAGPEAELAVAAVSGPAVNLEDLDGAPIGRSAAREVLSTGEPAVLEKLEDDIGSVPSTLVSGWPELGPVIVVPLRTDDMIAGALALGWKGEHFEGFREVDSKLVANFAKQAALALQVLRSRNAEHRLAVFEDRHRIGRDLHDLVIQRLFAVGLSLKSVSRSAEVPQVRDRIEAAIEDLDATIKDIRRSIFALGATEGAADLQTELTQLVQRAGATLKFRPTLELEGPVRTLVGEDTAPHLLAVLSETLSNASRHANATRIAVSVHVDESLRLVVVDNGTGLPAEIAESGLRNIRDRAVRLGGACSVGPSPGGGTTVRWTVPLR